MNKGYATDAPSNIATYTVVGNKGDDRKHPNAFFFDVKGVTPTLGDIKRAWPLEGDFHLSFRVKNKRFVVLPFTFVSRVTLLFSLCVRGVCTNASLFWLLRRNNMWVDVFGEHSEVPQFGGHVVIRAIRLASTL